MGFAHSQVGIGTRAPAGIPAEKNPDTVAIDHPQGILHLQGQHYYATDPSDSTIITRNLGFVVPRVQVEAKVNTDSIQTDTLSVTPNLVQAPDGGPAVEGTMVFDINSQCLRVKTADGVNGWKTRYGGCLVSESSDSLTAITDAYEGMPVRATKVSAGENFSLIIGGDDNMLYSTGYNYYGRTGLGITTSSNTQTFKMALARTVTDISAGFQHGMAVDSAGNVWAWGAGSNYRTGLGNTSNFAFPRKITIFDQSRGARVKGVRVEGGYYNSLILGSDGKVYTCGANTNGMNGNGLTSNYVITPTVVNIPTGTYPGTTKPVGIMDIAMSRYSAAAIDSLGRVWVWGNASNGRLGNGQTSSTVVPPTQILSAYKIKQVALGDGHGIAVSEDGKNLYGWGNAQAWGQPSATQATPIEITNYLPRDAKVGINGVNKADVYSPADTIVSVAATRFRGTSVFGTIVITSKSVYGAGNSSAAGSLGLGTIQRTGASPTAKYSPNTSISGSPFSGFYPIYEGAMYDGTVFKQASMGTTHSLIVAKETPKRDGNGGIERDVTTGEIIYDVGYGYGTGACNYYQLGSVAPTYSPIYIFTLLKK